MRILPLDPADAGTVAACHEVRTAALLRAQNEDALVDIHTTIVEEASAYRNGEIVELPMAAVLTSAAKPF